MDPIMSGELAEILRSRALMYLRSAERSFREGDYDVAANEAEYAAQIYIKYMIYGVSGEEARGHDIRGLLSLLAIFLKEQGFKEEAEEISEYVRRRRRLLAELSEAHVRAMCSITRYDKESAGLLISVARELIEMLGGLEARIFGRA